MYLLTTTLYHGQMAVKKITAVSFSFSTGPSVTLFFKDILAQVAQPDLPQLKKKRSKKAALVVQCGDDDSEVEVAQPDSPQPKKKRSKKATLVVQRGDDDSEVEQDPAKTLKIRIPSSKRKRSVSQLFVHEHGLTSSISGT